MGRQPYDTIDAMVRRIRPNPHIPALYYIRFVDHLQNREFEGALQSLHHYFDHCILVRHDCARPSAPRRLMYSTDL
jgi:hypothetical protein